VAVAGTAAVFAFAFGPAAAAAVRFELSLASLRRRISSAVSLLPVALLDAPEQGKRARVVASMREQ
jgi:hypothetical protein